MNTAPPIRRLVPLLLLLGSAAVLPAEAQRATVQIKVDASTASTRVVLTHSVPVAYEIRARDDRVEIAYAAPVRAEPAKLLLDDPILHRYELRRDTRLMLHTGPGYRTFESFELSNPFRLVIDLQGTRRTAIEEPIGQLPAQREDPSRTIIVIDPGHGGVEQGALGPTGLEEKTVALDISRRLRQILQQDRRLSIVMTRDEDRLVGLDERTSIANYNQADLFLSIHLNASTRPNAHGAETYFLSSDATDDEARTLAALENKAAGVSEESVVTVDGERREIDLVLWDLAQNQYMAESSVLAENVQIQLNEVAETRDRGVRQAPFRVLMGATMPAILVEVGFISNADEESLLRTTDYRSRVAQALATAVYEFLDDLQRLRGPSYSVAPGGAGQP